jgi:hypothetical protein
VIISSAQRLPDLGEQHGEDDPTEPGHGCSESAANPTSVSLRDWAIVTPRLPAEAAEAADRHLYFS